MARVADVQVSADVDLDQIQVRLPNELALYIKEASVGIFDAHGGTAMKHKAPSLRTGLYVVNLAGYSSALNNSIKLCSTTPTNELSGEFPVFTEVILTTAIMTKQINTMIEQTINAAS